MSAAELDTSTIDFTLDTWRAEFRKPRVEEAYRRYAWRDDSTAIRNALVVVLISIWIFIYSDYLFLGWSRTLALVVAMRLAMTMLTLWAMVDVAHPAQRRFAQKMIPLWLAAAVGMTVVLSLTRPATYWGLPVLNLAMCFAVYLYIPMALRQITLIMSVASFSTVAIGWYRGGFTFVELTALTVGFTFVNVFGHTTARRLNLLRRGDFAYRVSERRQRRRMANEILERRRIERRLIAATREAEEANRAKSSFLAAMSHEIRTPLTGILGFTQLLGETGLDPAQRAHVQVIERSGRTLTRLLNDILDLSKVEAGRVQIEAAPFDVAETIATLVDLIANRPQGRHVPIRVQGLEAGTAIWVQGDAARFQQILTNLLDNAVKFSNRAPVDLVVDSVAQDTNIALRIDVADRGPGVPDTLKPAIFEPYVTTPNRGASGAGAGLGLAIARRLVEAMGGAIVLADRVGGGSVFTLTLSLPKAQKPEAASPKVTTDTDATGGLHVLVVDDDEVNRLLISTVLKRWGHRVETAEDGRRGVDLARTGRFDAVLMDIRMPEMDGNEAIRLLKSDPDPALRALPIFALTANVMDEEVEAYRRDGADGILSKPIDLTALGAALASVRPQPQPRHDHAPRQARETLEAILAQVGPAAVRRAQRQLALTAPDLAREVAAHAAAGEAASMRHLAERLSQALESLGLSDVAGQVTGLAEPGALDMFLTELDRGLDEVGRRIAAAEQKFLETALESPGRRP